MLFDFDIFGYYVLFQMVCYFDGCLYDCFVVGVDVDVVYEILVDFDVVGWQLLQVIQ